MKRNRTRALDYVLVHRKKVIKGLGALIQILEAFPGRISGADLLAARKAKSKAAKSAKAKRPSKPNAEKANRKKKRRAAKSKKSVRRRTVRTPAEASPQEPLTVTTSEQPAAALGMP